MARIKEFLGLPMIETDLRYIDEKTVAAIWLDDPGEGMSLAARATTVRARRPLDCFSALTAMRRPRVTATNGHSIDWPSSTSSIGLREPVISSTVSVMPCSAALCATNVLAAAINFRWILFNALGPADRPRCG